VAVLFDDDYAGKNVAIGHPTKDPTYANRFEKIASYSKKPMTARLVKVTPADTTDGLSATDLRNAIQSGNTKELTRFIPDNIAKDYLKILIED
jgi:predicted nucleotidyltransferase